jgi:hypothetical protein
MSQQRRKAVFGFAIFTAVLIAIAVAPMMSRAAEPETAALSPTTAVTIVNNTSGEIRHVYFSATNDNNWGADQLNNSVIAVGGSQALNLSCSGASIKVIAEDEDGCFYYEVVSCSENSTWTINNNSARDCGN